jgi:hypothetical protein
MVAACGVTKRRGGGDATACRVANRGGEGNDDGVWRRKRRGGGKATACRVANRGDEEKGGSVAKRLPCTSFAALV